MHLNYKQKKKTKFYETTNGETDELKNGKMIFQKLYNALSTPPTQTLIEKQKSIFWPNS